MEQSDAATKNVWEEGPSITPALFCTDASCFQLRQPFFSFFFPKEFRRALRPHTESTQHGLKCRVSRKCETGGS